MTLTTTNVDRFADVLAATTGFITTLRLARHHDAIDVELDQVIIDDPDGSPTLVYRPVDAGLQRAPNVERIRITDVAHIHLW